MLPLFGSVTQQCVFFALKLLLLENISSLSVFVKYKSPSGKVKQMSLIKVKHFYFSSVIHLVTFFNRHHFSTRSCPYCDLLNSPMHGALYLLSIWYTDFYRLRLCNFQSNVLVIEIVDFSNMPKS